MVTAAFFFAAAGPPAPGGAMPEPNRDPSPGGQAWVDVVGSNPGLGIARQPVLLGEAPQLQRVCCTGVVASWASAARTASVAAASAT
jgi:hypothetical protein